MGEQSLHPVADIQEHKRKMFYIQFSESGNAVNLFLRLQES